MRRNKKNERKIRGLENAVVLDDAKLAEVHGGQYHRVPELMPDLSEIAEARRRWKVRLRAR